MKAIATTPTIIPVPFRACRSAEGSALPRRPMEVSPLWYVLGTCCRDQCKTTRPSGAQHPLTVLFGSGIELFIELPLRQVASRPGHRRRHRPLVADACADRVYLESRASAASGLSGAARRLRRGGRGLASELGAVSADAALCGDLLPAGRQLAGVLAGPGDRRTARAAVDRGDARERRVGGAERYSHAGSVRRRPPPRNEGVRRSNS